MLLQLQKERDALQAELDSLKQAQEGIKKELDTAKQEKEGLQKELEAAKQGREGLQKDLEAAQQRATSSDNMKQKVGWRSRGSSGVCSGDAWLRGGAAWHGSSLAPAAVAPLPRGLMPHQHVPPCPARHPAVGGCQGQAGGGHKKSAGDSVIASRSALQPDGQPQHAVLAPQPLASRQASGTAAFASTLL